MAAVGGHCLSSAIHLHPGTSWGSGVWIFMLLFQNQIMCIRSSRVHVWRVLPMNKTTILRHDSWFHFFNLNSELWQRRFKKHTVYTNRHSYKIWKKKLWSWCGFSLSFMDNKEGFNNLICCSGLFATGVTSQACFSGPTSYLVANWLVSQWSHPP